MSSIIILLLNVICFKMFDKIAADAEIKRKNDIYKQSIDIYKREMEERESETTESKTTHKAHGITRGADYYRR